MRKPNSKFTLAAITIAMLAFSGKALAQDVAVKGKLDKKLSELAKWAQDPKVIAAVESANSKPLHPDMTQEKWKGLGALDPIVVSLAKSEASGAIKQLKGKEVSEMFLNSKDGCKVALLAKTTSWCHNKHDKHKLPMQGKTWTGPIEVDESTQRKQVQLSVPVKSAKGDVIGSLVVGYDVNLL